MTYSSKGGIMRKQNKILIFQFVLLGIILFFTNSCTNNNPNPTLGWSALGNMDNLYRVNDLYIDSDGNLYAAGDFNNDIENVYVGKWDGSDWSEVGTLGTLGLNSSPLLICGDASSNLYVAGLFRNSEYINRVIKWDGSNWSDLGSPTNGTAYLQDMVTDAGGNLFVGVDIRVFFWNGSSWEVKNMAGFSHWVNALLAHPDGNLYVGGGAFTGGFGGAVGLGNGDGWSYVGDLSSYEQVHTLCTDANGNIYAGGGFESQSGYVVKWDGTSWTDLELNANRKVNSICTDPDGNLYAGGDFSNSSNGYYVAKWDGSNWTDMGLKANSTVSKLTYSDGYLYVAGTLHGELNDGHYIAVFR